VRWSESQIVLHWLKTATPLQRLIVHRVAEIKKLTADCEWRYCHTDTTPVNLQTRGISALQFDSSSLWAHVCVISLSGHARIRTSLPCLPLWSTVKLRMVRLQHMKKLPDFTSSSIFRIIAATQVGSSDVIRATFIDNSDARKCWPLTSCRLWWIIRAETPTVDHTTTALISWRGWQHTKCFENPQIVLTWVYDVSAPTTT